MARTRARILLRLPPLAAATFAACALLACSDTSGDDGSGGGGGATSATGGPGATSGSGSGTEPPAVEGITAAHNEARANVDPPAATPIPPLAWDDEIAAVAQAYAEECIWEHSQNDYGENLYAAAGAPATPQQVVDSWVSEAADYDYETGDCSGVCGHYTQVVWADSLRLGCGVANCTTGSPFDGFTEWQNWVCNYDPPGNFIGRKPY